MSKIKELQLKRTNAIKERAFNKKKKEQYQQQYNICNQRINIINNEITDFMNDTNDKAKEGLYEDQIVFLNTKHLINHEAIIEDLQLGTNKGIVIEIILFERKTFMEVSLQEISIERKEVSNG